MDGSVFAWHPCVNAVTRRMLGLTKEVRRYETVEVDFETHVVKGDSQLLYKNPLAIGVNPRSQGAHHSIPNS